MRAVAWPVAVILLPQILCAPAPVPGESAGDVMPVNIVCHDMETVEVTWGPVPGSVVRRNLSLAFRYKNSSGTCPQYFLLDSGVTSGCILPARAELLEITLRDGGGAEVFSQRRRPSAWLKPRPPWNVTFLWTDDAVTVSCPAYPYPGLDYDVQHRDAFDRDWQTTSAPRCNVTVVGLDPGRCYDFRVRARPQDFHYGFEAQASDWTQGMGPAASCVPSPAPPAAPPLPLACGLATLLTLVLLLVLLRLRRVKEALLPCVPDPRGSFPGLFEKHHGNFQAWIADAQAAAPALKPEKDDDIICPQAKLAENEDGPASPCQDLVGGALLSVGGAAFMVDSSGYVTL